MMCMYSIIIMIMYIAVLVHVMLLINLGTILVTQDLRLTSDVSELDAPIFLSC